MLLLTFKAFQEFNCVIISHDLRGNFGQSVSVISGYSVNSIYGGEEWGRRIAMCKTNGSSLGASPREPPCLWERVVHAFWRVVRWIRVQQYASSSAFFCILNLVTRIA